MKRILLLLFFAVWAVHITRANTLPLTRQQLPAITLGMNGDLFRHANAPSVPPDPAGAVGRSKVFATVNWRLTLLDRSNWRVLDYVDGKQFFNHGGSHFDARCSFDGQRFWVTAVSPAGLSFARSRHEHITTLSNTDWEIDKIGLPIGTDYPVHAVHKSGLLVNFSMPADKFFRIKPKLVSGFETSSIPIPPQYQLGGVLTPAVDPVTGSLWFMRLGFRKWSTPTGDDWSNHILLLRVDDPFGAANLVSFGEHPVAKLDSRLSMVDPGGPVPGVQPFGNAQISSKGKLFHCVAMGGYVHWYQFDVSSEHPDLEQEGFIGNGDSYNPAIAVNARGDVGLCYLRSSRTEFVTVCVTGRSESDAPDTMRAALEVKKSTVKQRGSRMGDFAGICLDPSNDSFWGINQYAAEPNGGNANWVTYAAQFTLKVIEPIPPPSIWQDYSGTITIDGVQYTIKGQIQKAGGK